MAIQTLFGSVPQEPNLLDRLKAGIEKTRAGLVDRVEDLLAGRKEIDAELLEEFVAQMLQAAHQASCNFHDLICTATHFVARAIAASVRRFLPDIPPPRRLLLSGGGTRNGFLWHLLEQQFAGWELDKTDAFGVAGEARKALGFGVLAALTLDGVPGNVPSATGAAGARLLGSITPGASANWARS